MQVKIPTENGYIADRYSKYAAPDEMYQGRPAISFPVSFTDLPEKAQTIAWTLVDVDAVPVSGFTWIHWLGANLAVNDATLLEDASRRGEDRFIQGKNSNAGGLIHNEDPLTNEHYVGPTPPNEDHEYTFTAYALDERLPLKNGYWLNEFYRAIEDHVLEQTTVTFMSRA